MLNFLTLHNVSKEYTLKNDLVWDTSFETNYKICNNDTIQFKVFEAEYLDELPFDKKYLTALKFVLQDNVSCSG